MNIISYISRFEFDLRSIENAIRENGKSSQSYEVSKFIIALEDRRFFKHKGIDAISSVRELIKFFTRQKFGGASTIEMQLCRTVTNLRGITLHRKIYEMILSVFVSARNSKPSIINTYTNIAYFGYGSFGARSYLNRYKEEFQGLKPMKVAAIAAASLRYPRPQLYSQAWRKSVEDRAEYALKIVRMRKVGFDY